MMQLIQGKDYFFELFTIPDERKHGVYSFDTKSGKMWTKDNEGNTFQVFSSGKCRSKISVSLNLDTESEQEDEDY